MVKQKIRSFDPLTSLIVIGVIIAVLILINPLTTGTDKTGENIDSSATKEIQIKPQSQGIMDTKLDFSIDEFITTARDLEGASYQSGGSDPREGFNSSGFVQYVYGHSTGIRMPRIAEHQYELGEEVGKDFFKQVTSFFSKQIRSCQESTSGITSS